MARKVQTQNKGTEEARGENDMGGGVEGGRGGNNRNLDGHFIRALNKIELQSLMIRAIIETNKTNKTSPLLISRGNNMIQNAVWCQSTQVNFSDIKIVRARRTSAICSLQNITSTYLQQIALEKASQNVETNENLIARALFAI